MFNKKQLIIMWIVGIITCLFLISSSGIDALIPPKPSASNLDKWLYERRFKRVDWNSAILYPLFVISGLLVVTFAKRKTTF